MARNKCALLSIALGHLLTLGNRGSTQLKKLDYIFDEAFALVVVSAVLVSGIEEKIVVNVAVIFNFQIVAPNAAHLWETVLETGSIAEVALFTVL
jgi:hypothetical protein